jgi:hypothetical protein
MLVLVLVCVPDIVSDIVSRYVDFYPGQNSELHDQRGPFIDPRARRRLLFGEFIVTVRMGGHCRIDVDAVYLYRRHSLKALKSKSRHTQQANSMICVLLSAFVRRNTQAKHYFSILQQFH